MKKIFSFALLTALLLPLTWGFASEDLSSELQENIVRLHILANSDAACDQALKLKVRDRLLDQSKKTSDLLTDAEIIACCKEEIAKNGFSYPVTLERGNFYFPQKAYDNITLPAGNYNAVRIVIGSGQGQNWWCVMYPPLCFSEKSCGALDADGLDLLRNSLSSETYTAICESNSITIKPTFKLLELWQELKSRLNG